MSRGEIEVFPSVDALATVAADSFVTAARQSIESGGRFTVALSGGSTPRPVYERLATPAYATRVDWSKVHVFWGDERCVPPADPASNYRLARETLLDNVPIAVGNVHRIRGEEEPRAAAAEYERLLREQLAQAGFDLVLLGMGADGHTASVFPRSAAAGERRRWVMPEYVAAVAGWRVTVTAPLINRSARVVFLVAGADKATALRMALNAPYDPAALPAQLIAPESGELRWLVEEAAARELSRTRQSSQ